MSPPAKLLLGSVGAFVALSVAEAQFGLVDRVEGRPLLDGLLTLGTLLPLLSALAALVWWPFHRRAHDRCELEGHAAIVDEQAAVDWHVTAIDELDELPVVTVHRADTGAHRQVIGLADDEHGHGTVPVLGARVVLTVLEIGTHSFIELHDRDGWTDVEFDGEEFRGRDLTDDEAAAFAEASAPRWPTS